MIALADHTGDGLSTFGLVILAVWAVWVAYDLGRRRQRAADGEARRRAEGFRRAHKIEERG